MFQNVQPGQESLIGQSKISNGISTSLILPLTSLCDLFFRTVTLLTLTHETLEEILTTPQPRIPTPPPPPRGAEMSRSGEHMQAVTPAKQGLPTPCPTAPSLQWECRAAEIAKPKYASSRC